MNSIFCHEDDYCQIEIVPANNFFSIQDEIESIQNFSISDGEGYANLYVRSNIRYPLETLQIKYTDLTNIVGKNSVLFFDTVNIGYSSHSKILPDNEAYAFENYVMFITSKNGMINKVWIAYKRLSETLNVYPKRLQTVLSEIGLNWKVFLIDWNNYYFCNLQNPKSIDQYLDLL